MIRAIDAIAARVAPALHEGETGRSRDAGNARAPWQLYYNAVHGQMRTRSAAGDVGHDHGLADGRESLAGDP